VGVAGGHKTVAHGTRASATSATRPHTRHAGRFALLIAVTVGLALALPAVALATIVSSTEQIEQPKKWNGKTITYRGEVVGDILHRGDFAWINVNDDTYQDRSVEGGHKLAGYNSGQSVWVPSYLVEQIAYLGRYTASGDRVEVTGVFHAACPEHGGDMDIHAASLTIVKRGHDVGHSLDPRRVVAAIVLLVIAGALFAANRRAELRRV